MRRDGRLVMLLLVFVLLASVWSPSPVRAVATVHLRGDRSHYASTWVDVGGYRLYARCLGSGSPVVLLDDAGFVETWALVHPGIAGYTRVCAYDRAGLGLSDDGPLPTSTLQMAREIQRLIHGLHVPGPFVLVGQGFGGTTARLYASHFPRDLVGLILVDAVPTALFGNNALVRNYESVDFSASRREMQKAGPLGKLPLVVLSHGIPYSYPPTVERVWLRYQRQFAHLSSNATLVIARSGQNIPMVQPGLVVAAVRQILVALRDPAHHLPACITAYQRSEGQCASP